MGSFTQVCDSRERHWHAKIDSSHVAVGPALELGANEGGSDPSTEGCWEGRTEGCWEGRTDFDGGLDFCAEGLGDFVGA